MKESWKEIKDYEGLYWVSNLGHIKNKHNKILKPEYSNKDYACIQLRKDSRMKKYRVHRLVAEAFIPNPLGLPEINHVDENKHNNQVSNLEWCTHIQNMKSYTEKHPERNNNEKAVYCFDLDECFKSITEAAIKTKVNRTSILKACRGQLHQAGGKLWCYAKNKDKKFTHR